MGFSSLAVAACEQRRSRMAQGRWCGAGIAGGQLDGGAESLGWEWWVKGKYMDVVGISMGYYIRLIKH